MMPSPPSPDEGDWSAAKKNEVESPDIILNGYDSDDMRFDNPFMQNHRDAEQQYPISSRSEVAPNEWTDVFPSDPTVDVHFSIDKSTKESWEKGIHDIIRLRKRMNELVLSKQNQNDDNNNDNNNDTLQIESEKTLGMIDLFNLIFGYNSSEFGQVFCKELSLDELTFTKFLGNLFLQMSFSYVH